MKNVIMQILTPQNIDFTKGNLKRKIIVFSLPIILQSFLQIIFSSFDMLILSYFGGGQDSLAAIGNSLNLVNLIVNMFTGFSGSIAILLAAANSKNNREVSSRLIGISMFLGITIGILGLIVCVTFAYTFLNAINTPSVIIDSAVIHFRCYFMAFPFMMLTNFYISILFALGNSRSVFYNTVIRSMLQTGLSFLFVAVFKLDILGVGIATFISITIQSIHGFYSVFLSKTSIEKFNISKIKFYKKEFLSIAKTGVLLGGSRFLISFANTSLQSEIGSYGEVILVGASIVNIFFSLVFYGMDAVGSACMVGISQNYGIKKEYNYKKIFKYSFLMIVLVYIFVSVPIMIFSSDLISFFLAEKNTIVDKMISDAWKAGMIKLFLLIGPSFVYGFMQCLNSVFNGLGSQQIPLLNTLFTSTIFRLLFVIVLSLIFTDRDFLSYGLLVSSVPISWILSALVSLIIIVFIFKKGVKYDK